MRHYREVHGNNYYLLTLHQLSLGIFTIIYRTEYKVDLTSIQARDSRK
jgi:hypothetical protein